jgi:hypothetical protein
VAAAMRWFTRSKFSAIVVCAIPEVSTLKS